MRRQMYLKKWEWSLCFVLSLIITNVFGGGTWDLYDDFNTGTVPDSGKWAASTFFGSPIVSPSLTAQKMVFDLSQEQLTIMRTGDAVSGVRADIQLTGSIVLWSASGGIALETDKYFATAELQFEEDQVYVRFGISNMSGGTVAAGGPYRLELPGEMGTMFDLAIFHDGTDFWFAYQNRVVTTTKGKAVLLPSTPVDTWVHASSDGGGGTLNLRVDNVQLFNQTAAPVIFSASSQTVLVSEGGSTQFTVDLASPQPTPVTITPYAIDDSTGSGVTILDELHNLTDPGPLTIAVSNITAGSIVITDLAGGITYTEGVDYSLNLLSDRLEVTRIPSGSISAGQTILVDYQYANGSTNFGDSDLTISGAQTIDVGNTQATFTISAADDADWSNGSTTFELHVSDDSRVLVRAVEVDDEHHHSWSVFDDFSGASLDTTKWNFMPDATLFSLDTLNDQMVMDLTYAEPTEYRLASVLDVTNVWGISARMSLSELDPGNARLSLALNTDAFSASVSLDKDIDRVDIYASITRQGFEHLCSAVIDASLNQEYDASIKFDGRDFWIEVDGIPLIDSRCADLTPSTLGSANVELGVFNSGRFKAYISDVNVYQNLPPSATLSAITPTNVSPITVTALFNEPVSGFDDLATDVTVSSGTAGNLNSVSASEYTFDITPAGDGDITVTVLAESATAVSDGRGNTASSAIITYDGTPPSVPGIAYISEDRGSSSTDGVTNDQTLIIYGTSDPGTASIDVYLDSVSIGTTTNINSEGDWIFDYTGTSILTGVYSLTADATDAAGNTSATSTAYGITIDITAPSVVASTSAIQPVDTTFPVTATFSENVTGLAVGDITVTNGTVSSFIEVDPSQYTFDVTPAAEGEVTIIVMGDTAQDVAGNGNTASPILSVIVDSPPTVVLSTSSASVVNGPFAVEALFSEPVTGLNPNGISVTNGTVTALTGTAELYTITIAPERDGSVTVSIPAGAAQGSSNQDNLLSNSITVTYKKRRHRGGCTIDSRSDHSFMITITILLLSLSGLRFQTLLNGKMKRP